MLSLRLYERGCHTRRTLTFLTTNKELARLLLFRRGRCDHGTSRLVNNRSLNPWELLVAQSRHRTLLESRSLRVSARQSEVPVSRREAGIESALFIYNPKRVDAWLDYSIRTDFLRGLARWCDRSVGPQPNPATSLPKSSIMAWSFSSLHEQQG